MPDTKCPIVFCQGSHPLKTDKSAAPFVFCPTAGSNVWFRSPGAQKWLNRSGGSVQRENPVKPVRTVFSEGRRRVVLEGEVDLDELMGGD